MRKCLHILLLTIMMSVTSCQHKDLCIHHPHGISIRVEFDWRNAPEADPEGMCVFFFPKDGGQPYRYDFNNTTGGRIDIPAGSYNVTCYNNDTEGVLFRERNDFHSHEAYTREGNLFESIYGNGYSVPHQVKDATEERVVICPDMMWGCSITEADIMDSGLKYICSNEMELIENTEHIIMMYPSELTCIYTYEIRNVKNLKHVSQLCASLSGMSGGMNLSTLALQEESVTLPLESSTDKVSTIYGKFITFGHHEQNDDPHRMMLYIWMDDGQKYLFGSDSERFDVTDQIHNAPDKRKVHIIIDGLDLPQPIENGHGYSPSVDDWDTLYEDILM